MTFHATNEQGLDFERVTMMSIEADSYEEAAVILAQETTGLEHFACNDTYCGWDDVPVFVWQDGQPSRRVFVAPVG